MSHQPEEVEVKIRCKDLDRVREHLRRAGATQTRPLHEEQNVLFDDASARLEREGRLLRVRSVDGCHWVTYKGPARFEEGIRHREERQTTVSDAQEFEAILHGLGLRPTFRYQKRREEWKLDSCAVALDETPIGRFVEIEGDPAAIRRVVSALELDFGEAIPYSYPRLYAREREANPSLPRDMVWG